MKYLVKNKIGILLLPVLMFVFYACNDDKIFEGELYKKVFALVNTDDKYNECNVVYKMDKPEQTGYISASLGGTEASDRDINITLFQDMTVFDNYNRVNFDVDVDKYVHLLPPAHYSIDNYTFTIPKGERIGKMPIRVRPEGLSPDSTYFLPLRVASYSAYEVNPERSTLLYRVMIANDYAVQGSTAESRYSMMGTRNGTNILGNKEMQPLTGKRVRMMAGNESYEAKLEKIYNLGIILEVGNDNKVTILPYKTIEVKQVDGDPEFPNIFKIENDGFRTFKTFLLSYEYKNGKDVFLMKEELRMEIKK